MGGSWDGSACPPLTSGRLTLGRSLRRAPFLLADQLTLTIPQADRNPANGNGSLSPTLHTRPMSNYRTGNGEADATRLLYRPLTRRIEWRLWLYETLRGTAICLTSMLVTLVIVMCALWLR